MSTMREKLDALEADPCFVPVNGSPGNWMDTRTGARFHWTQFQLGPRPVKVYRDGTWMDGDGVYHVHPVINPSSVIL